MHTADRDVVESRRFLEYVRRLHLSSRDKLYVFGEESFFISLIYIDAMRHTRNQDNVDESTNAVCLNVDGRRKSQQLGLKLQGVQRSSDLRQRVFLGSLEDERTFRSLQDLTKVRSPLD